MSTSANHSLLKLFTGFATAALIAWKLMVNNAINTAVTPATKNIHQFILIRYAKSFSHSCMKYQASGAAMIKERNTNFKKSIDNKLTIFETEAPMTFLIPISLVRCIVL